MTKYLATIIYYLSLWLPPDVQIGTAATVIFVHNLPNICVHQYCMRDAPFSVACVFSEY